MCGICGAMSADGGAIEPGLAGRMAEALAHRGPDDAGTFEAPGVQLAHRRLSLLDLAGGAQPMAGEAGDVVVAFNGEIYNFNSLREELTARGHRFRTRSDTEVIPHAYEEWGDAAVERLRGMFALALWDARRRRLLLARDRLGIKPLFYAWARREAAPGGLLLFASELKAILSTGLVERRLDPHALHDYLSLQAPFAPRTMFAGVRALEPGCLVIFEGPRVEERRWYVPRLTPREDLTEEAALAALDERLGATLRDQVVADVPVGAFLSGGIDSSLVVSHLASLRGGPFDTFTVGWDDAQADESAIARRTATQLGARHHELRVPSDAVSAELIRRVLDQFDQPFGDSSAIPTWLVSQKTREHVKTVLSGDGGDELFGGYVSYRVARRLSQVRRVPPPARRALAELARVISTSPLGAPSERARQVRKALAIAALSPPEALFALRSYFDEDDKRALYRPEHAGRLGGYRTASWFEPAAREHGDLVEALVAYDLRHRLAGDMLAKVDTMSMAHGLEVRVPLLDERVVELALTLPARLRVRGDTMKYLLRRSAARRGLPKEVVGKRKTGFTIPITNAARGAISALIAECFEERRPRTEAIFDVAKVRPLFAALRDGSPPPGGISRWQLEQRVYIMVGLERWMARWDVTAG